MSMTRRLPIGKTRFASANSRRSTGTSKERTLYPARSESPKNSRIRPAISGNDGAPATSASEIPCTRVDSRGIFTPGFTRDSQAATAPPGPKRRAAISTIRSVSRSAPVVSRSKTTSGRSPVRAESAASGSGGSVGSVTPASWPRNGRGGARRLPGPGRSGRHSGRIRPDETRRVQERRRVAAFAPRVVSGVPEERRAEVKQVNAELMHAARLRHELDERRRAAVLEHAIARRGRAARRVSCRAAGRRQGLDREHAAAREEVSRPRGAVGGLQGPLQKVRPRRAVLEQGSVHAPLGRIGDAPRDREIGLLDPRRPGRVRGGQRLRAPREKEDARRLPVEPVDERDPAAELLAQRPEEAARAVYRDAG